MSVQDTACRFAWDYPVVSFNQNGLRSCCRALPDTVTPEDIDYHGKQLFTEFKPLVDMRKDLLTGVKTKACDSCWKLEEAGTESARTGIVPLTNYLLSSGWSNSLPASQQPHEVEPLAKYAPPRMLELSLSSVCDLKCMYCNHHYSSQWMAEKLKHKEIIPIHHAAEMPEPNPEFQRLFWEWFEDEAYKTVNTINFIGGEPLLITEFYEALDRVVAVYETNDDAPSHVTLSVVSNFNTPERYFDLFLDRIARTITNSSRFHFNINASFEAVGARTEFIRSGSDWRTISRNVHKLLTVMAKFPDSRTSFGFIPSLNPLSITGLPDFVRYVVATQRTFPKIKLHLRRNQIVFPQWMAPALLPPKYVEYVDEAVQVLDTLKVDHESYFAYGRWDLFRDFLLSVRASIATYKKDEDTQKSFRKNVEKLAGRRNLDFNGTFPEMVPFMESLRDIPPAPPPRTT